MELQGKVIQFLGETSGTSKAGNPWKKKEWVVETFSQYPRRVKIQCFGDRADSINLEVGKDYTLSIDLESREFNGRWYTDVSVFRAADYANPQSFGGQPQGGYNSGFGAGAPSGISEGVSFGGDQFGNPNVSFAPDAGDSDEDLPF